MNKNTLDITGEIFTDLKVISREENNYYGRTMWLCKCVCGRNKIVSTKSLRNGDTKSCGECFSYKKEQRKIGSFNKYDLSGRFGIGYDHLDNPFYFDIDDYDKIKMFRWIVTSGYVKAYSLGRYDKKMIYLHRTILGLNNEKNIIVDHINRNPLDNRKENLRIATHKENTRNQKISKRNSSGFIGIDYMKSKLKYRARINLEDGTSFHLGIFEEIEDAVITRLKAEKEIYGEFAPQKHLFEEYGI